MKKFALLALVSLLAACNTGPLEDFNVNVTPTTISNLSETSNPLQANLCSDSTFRGNVSVTLENPPTGVTLKDSPKSLTVFGCGESGNALAVQAPGNLAINFAKGANSGTFKLVFASKNVTKKINLTVEVSEIAPPVK